MKYMYGTYPIRCRIEKHWRYLKYVLKHKWYVFIECCKLGIPIRGLLHDMSKFRSSEWFPYAEMFYGKYGYGWNGGYAWEFIKVNQTIQKFNKAWLLHQHRNPHHWQYWILVQDDDPTEQVLVPKRYLLEMIADWRGASRSIKGFDNTKEWYVLHKDKIQLNPASRLAIENRLKMNEVLRHGN